MAEHQEPVGELTVSTDRSWFWNWSTWSWSLESASTLQKAEKKILSHLSTAYSGCYVNIGAVVGDADKIWTISLNEESDNTPILLLHGLGAGVAMWCLNLDALAESRPVYAIDILGFGRSSRPKFSSDALEAEKQLVRSVEEWRRVMNIDHFVLLGHSLGGFLASSYTLDYPDRVKHLILAEPWGINTADFERNLDVWVWSMSFAMQLLNPLTILRVAGPFGEALIEKCKPHIIEKLASFTMGDKTVICQYIFQCNVQNPSGESAFHTMMAGYGWRAKNPMIDRIDGLAPHIPITLIYGSRSWLDSRAGKVIKEMRPNSYVNFLVFNEAGHIVYTDVPPLFNRHVVDACALADAVDDPWEDSPSLSMSDFTKLTRKESQEELRLEQNDSD